MASNTMRGRFVEVATDLLDERRDIAVVLAEISADRFAANGALERHPERVVNVGIREQLMVNVAAGMALEGMRPITHTFAPFLIERSFEQVKLGFSHQGVGGVLVSWGAPYDVAAYGRTHQTAADVALMATLPDWTIHIPGHPDEAEMFLREAAETSEAVYIRLSQQQNARPHAVRGGGLAVVRDGGPGTPTIVAIGPMLDAATEAVAEVDATVLYAATVRPFDSAGLRSATTGTEVILVEPCVEGTMAADVSAALSDRPMRLLSIGVPRPEHRRYGTPDEHNAAHGLDAGGIRKRILRWLQGDPA